MNHEGMMNYLRDISLEAKEVGAKAPTVLALLKDLEKTVDDCRELVMESAIQEVSKHGKEGVTVGGYKMVSKQGACRYTYQGDAWKQAKEYLDSIQDVAKMASRLQQPMPGPDGVLVEPALPKFDKDTVVLTKARS